MSNPAEILNNSLDLASRNLSKSAAKDKSIRQQIEYVCRQLSNRACTRLLMACMLAKLDRPEIDPRKPYTEIGDEDSFSGRTYDERYITHFINANRLPLNSTTAFLTPAFRNLYRPLTTDTDLIGRPRELYRSTLQLLDDVYTNRVTAKAVLIEIIRILLIMRDEKLSRINTLLAGLEHTGDLHILSSEEIVTLIDQHLKCKNSSRLPVLIIAAAYRSVGDMFGENVLPLKSHNAADEQTGAFGDVEICLHNDNQVVTAYEMKTRRVTIDDIDRALEKIALANEKIHNYIFVTTDAIDHDVKAYAIECYERTNGTEIAVLDCLGFLRHFLHFFHRSRVTFLEAYQELVLNEPDSAVSQALKEAFLALRQVAESD
jgi:hypothetical protein